jgi:hypothetical protein
MNTSHISVQSKQARPKSANRYPVGILTTGKHRSRMEQKEKLCSDMSTSTNASFLRGEKLTGGGNAYCLN